MYILHVMRALAFIENVKKDEVVRGGAGKSELNNKALLWCMFKDKHTY